MPHQAAIIKAATTPLVVESVETPSPGPGQILVKVDVVAFNPLEAKIQKLVYSTPPRTHH
jgi:NADPH:quinone reductase-like Zn-dependent oxidoreductase